ncbi:hypothetical protein H6P81_020000 [Aristolochia fimbriata]|uniref:Uncharacterized protein n=1 Tax=Aristolochia fimbriata TaxID=158543 RepID=A0AAV7DT64_ARIFI|nr:hypothetical protein H6P81_020000 [Aristolochia fimbriata]
MVYVLTNTRETEDDKSVVRKSKPILGELANAIDERLYYYEQVIELCAKKLRVQLVVMGNALAMILS